MHVVIALGGNALVSPDEPISAEAQRRKVSETARALEHIMRNHRVTMTHGNGPQVGLLAMRSDTAHDDEPAYPLDVLGAESQAMIGYIIEQELRNVLDGDQVAMLLTQVVVNQNDTAFKNPTKPIGPNYTEQEGQRLKEERGWAMTEKNGKLRRIVPSPLPERIVEIDTIKRLVDEGVVVICAGGGGVPVTLDQSGKIRGVEGVIDKDRASARLAQQLDADLLMILTDVPSVALNYGTPDQRWIRRVTPQALKGHHFEAGSMGPKVEACIDFVEITRSRAAIGSLDDALSILEGEAGTQIMAGTFETEFYEQ